MIVYCGKPFYRYRKVTRIKSSYLCSKYIQTNNGQKGGRNESYKKN